MRLALPARVSRCSLAELRNIPIFPHVGIGHNTHMSKGIGSEGVSVPGQSMMLQCRNTETERYGSEKSQGPNHRTFHLRHTIRNAERAGREAGEGNALFSAQFGEPV